MKIVLPWPNKDLSPNSRLHWAPKAKAKAAAREVAFWLTKEALNKRPGWSAPDGAIPFHVAFYPPDKRHRDDDNMVGSFKAHRDGIAEALGVDDRRFKAHYFFEDAEKPGRVEVTI